MGAQSAAQPCLEHWEDAEEGGWQLEEGQRGEGRVELEEGTAKPRGTDVFNSSVASLASLTASLVVVVSVLYCWVHTFCALFTPCYALSTAESCV